MTELNVTRPDGATEPPSCLDDSDRDIKQGFQERLDLDHDFTVAENLIKEAEDGGGLHRKVTLAEALDIDPELSAGQAALYSKLIETVLEMFLRVGTGDPIQLTEAGALKPAPDESTVVLDEEGKLAVPVDDFTIGVVDAAVAVKDPEKTDDAVGCVAPVIAWGEYTGNGSATARTVADMGIKAKVVLICAATGASARVSWLVFLSGSGSKACRMDTAALSDSSVYIESDRYLKTATADMYLNYNGWTYFWLAIGERLPAA